MSIRKITSNPKPNTFKTAQLSLESYMKIDEKNDLLPSLLFGYYFRNIKFPLNPIVLSIKKYSHQFSCKIQVIGSAITTFDGSRYVEFLQEATAASSSSFGAYRFNITNRIKAITAIKMKTENPWA